MAEITKDFCRDDFCHLCGQHGNEIANVRYPKNAHAKGPAAPNTAYVRICSTCALAIHAAAIERYPPEPEEEEGS